MGDAISLKIDRADKHILELQDVMHRFWDSHPYEVVRNQDAITGEFVYCISDIESIPDDVPLIIGDIVHNLHCSLDYLAWDLTNTQTISTAFPISDEIPTTTKQIARYDRQVEGMGEEAKTIINGLGIHRGTNGNLWRLHQLNNLNKHRTLITTVINATTVSGSPDLLKNSRFCFSALQKGSEVARTPDRTKNEDDIRFTFQIALNEPKADCVGLQAMPTMQRFQFMVRDAANPLFCHRKILLTNDNKLLIKKL
jgi:hypothetical protein